MGLDYIEDREESLKARIEEVRKKFEKSYPSKNGLKIPEILMLYYARTYNTSQTDFQSFWLYDYGVLEPDVMLKKLHNKGFVTIAPARESIKNLTVPEIKDLLKSLGQKVTGKKAELIDRLIFNSDDDFLEENITKRYYDLTELGREELKENEYVVYCHKHRYNYYIPNVFSINKIIHDSPNENYIDLIYNDLKKTRKSYYKQITQNNECYLWKSYIINGQNLCDFLSEFNHYTEALDYIIESIYYDINIESAYGYYLVYNNIKKGYIYEKEYRINNEFRYDYAKAFKIIHENIELTNKTFYDIIKSSLESFRYPKQLISNDDLAKLIICWVNDDETGMESIYKQIEKDIIEKNTFEKYYRNDILEENIKTKSDFNESDNISLEKLPENKEISQANATVQHPMPVPIAPQTIQNKATSQPIQKIPVQPLNNSNISEPQTNNDTNPCTQEQKDPLHGWGGCLGCLGCMLVLILIICLIIVAIKLFSYIKLKERP